jgi:DNA repair protein RecN (Recombination protein N)
MLIELTVTNLVIVERACLRPGAGLTVISGETGAGKSLLLDALELVAGGRASSDMVGPTGEAIEVAAVIAAPPGRAAAVATACAVEADDGRFILRRRVAGNGRSGAWINDTPVTVAALRAAAGQLIEVHAQGTAVRLADPATQLAALDAAGGHLPLAADYRAAHRRCLDLAAEARELADGARGSARELDFLRFQLAEIDALKPKASEFTELESRHRLLAEAETWRARCAEAVDELSEGERSCSRLIGRHARRLAEAPLPALAAAGRALADAAAAVTDAASAAAGAIEQLDADPGELARIEERLNAYHQLMRKHGDGEATLFAAWQQLRERAEALGDLDGRQAKVAAALAEAQAERSRLGTRLAAARRAAFAPLAEAVHRHLADLAMPKARLLLHEAAEAEPGPHGTINQLWHIRTNPGLPAGPLADVASGGETSRILLALAAALAGDAAAPVTVFDEVDSGVGGRLGAAIGGKLARMAGDRSVLAVTHTPQVAAAARMHYVVRKHQGRERTRVSVEALDGTARASELAEMLGGGKAAQAQAQALLAEAAR